jgi:glucose-1-phosphate cytidylyltransferase
MKVVILCGGKGTRFREETELRPKPMVTIGDRPILWHIMKLYAHHGFNEFVLCLGYKGDVIKEYFHRFEAFNHDSTIELGTGKITVHRTSPGVDWKVTLADTGEDAMTGARVKRVERYLDGDRFMLTYGDGVTDLDLGKVLEFHRAHGKLATVTGVRPVARFGELLIEDQRVRAFSEKPQVTDSHVSGGFFIFERAVLDLLSPDDDCVLELKPLEALAARGELMAYQHDGFWHCMDTYRDYTILNNLWARTPPWRVWDR